MYLMAISAREGPTSLLLAAWQAKQFCFLNKSAGGMSVAEALDDDAEAGALEVVLVVVEPAWASRPRSEPGSLATGGRVVSTPRKGP